MALLIKYFVIKYKYKYTCIFIIFSASSITRGLVIYIFEATNPMF